MARYIRKERLKQAIQSISLWRAATQSQASKHLFPFLALIEKGVTTAGFHQYEEADDFAFFDKFFRVEGDPQHPYFDPLTLKRRIPTHPHSNVATARKGTFQDSWKAAESRLVNDDEDTEWKLSPAFDDIIVARVMTRAGEVTRPNVLDIAVWLFREHEFHDDADAKTLEQLFRASFPINDKSYNKLFEFNDEPPENLYSSTKLTDTDIRQVVADTMLPSDDAAPKPVAPPLAKSDLGEDDPILLEVRSVLAINSSGVIFRGCPGTGKTWYAWNVALWDRA